MDFALRKPDRPTEAAEAEASEIEKDLLQRFIAGDSEAREVLFTRHRIRLYVLCLRMLENREDAEDALQETFYRASRYATFRGTGFTTWIYRIAVNVCRSFLSKRAARRRHEFEAAKEAESEPVLTPSQVYRRRITEREVSDALDELQQVHRETILLKYLENMTATQIAEVLRVPLSTVEGRLRHGRQKLRKILQRRNRL